ncbi:UDP-glucuronate 4-epimerase 1 [Panicum miliaceum]|uniref:UDP-glucuronate 4-epimerase 1 n=1 Tax=Panicum miliaceum TaxID=4540 RepID=A0A3L6T9N7_PANMI|nr:UDP-glucuronate 4-epimerase 1 [Panicum miliaceum]
MRSSPVDSRRRAAAPASCGAVDPEADIEAPPDLDVGAPPARVLGRRPPRATVGGRWVSDQHAPPLVGAGRAACRRLSRPDTAYFSFTRNILQGKPITVYRGKNHVDLARDFTYIDDIVKGCLGSLDTAGESTGTGSSG